MDAAAAIFIGLGKIPVRKQIICVVIFKGDRSLKALANCGQRSFVRRSSWETKKEKDSNRQTKSFHSGKRGFLQEFRHVSALLLQQPKDE